MDKNIPRSIIVLLSNWYAKAYTVIKWNSVVSFKVHLTAGVRQGGVLSPYLFSILVDPVLVKLKDSALGCRLKGIMFNAIIYADDLLLLSISLSDLQAMVDICVKEFADIDLTINLKKSVCMRIGINHKSIVSNICINSSCLLWKSEIRFLGVSFVSSNSLMCNLQIVRQKYFRALNGVFGKIGAHSTVSVTLSLINSLCVPILSYGLEAVYVSRAMCNEMETAYSAGFSKIFVTLRQDNY